MKRLILPILLSGIAVLALSFWLVTPNLLEAPPPAHEVALSTDTEARLLSPLEE